MVYIKRLIKVLLVVLVFFLFIPSIKEEIVKEKVDNMIYLDKGKSIYDGYIMIPRLEYKNLIKKDNNALSNNLIELLSFSDNIGESNIILAGHNNKLGFNTLYKLNKDDEIIISDFDIDYKYIVSEIKYIDVDDYSIFDNEDSLTMITCTYDNQKRFVVVAKRV